MPIKPVIILWQCIYNIVPVENIGTQKKQKVFNIVITIVLEVSAKVVNVKQEGTQEKQKTWNIVITPVSVQR